MSAGLVGLIVWLLIVSNLSLLVHAQAPIPQENSAFFVVGCSHEKLESSTIENINALTKYFKNSNVFIFGPDAVEKSDLGKLNGKFVHIKERPNTATKKTGKLARCRNRLMKAVHEEVKEKGMGNKKNEAYIAMMDLDIVSHKPFNLSSFEYVMHHAHQWDVVAFHKDDMDIWPLRYARLNLNVMNFGENDEEHNAMIHVLKRDIHREFYGPFLKPYHDAFDGPFFKLYSAFNGVNIIKHSFTHGCHHNSTSTEFIIRRGDKEGEDSEHVSFYKCIHNKGGRVRMYRYPLNQ